MEPTRYTPPSKALIRDLSSDIRVLAHQRLSSHLRFIQTRYGFSNADIADAMNACPAVIGIRGRHGRAFAPISENKITRFKDGHTRPQTLTLKQMTAFLAHNFKIPPSLFWSDMDDALAGLHNARRFRKERIRRALLELADCWLFCELQTPFFSMAFRLSPLLSASVILVQGRLVQFGKVELSNPGNHGWGFEFIDPLLDVFAAGYATLTPRNLNLHLRDTDGRQIVLYLDVDAGPFGDDSTQAPYLVIKQATINLPSDYGVSLPPIFRTTKTIGNRQDYIAKLTDYNIFGDQGRPHSASFFSFSALEWTMLQNASKGDDQIRNDLAQIEPSLSSSGLLMPPLPARGSVPAHTASDVAQIVAEIKHLIARAESL